MTEIFVPRRLTFEQDRKVVTINADEVLTDARLVGRPLVLLGEAGSGKSELLCRWSGGPVLTARQVIHGRQPPQGRTLIDGLDETTGINEGDALDRLLGALEAQQNIDFILACRIADWRSATGTATIREWTGSNPIELSIQPLDRSDAVTFLQTRGGLKGSTAEEFVSHYEERHLGDWLGNPQTLKMLAEVSKLTQRPESAGALFRLFAEQAWVEPRKQHTPLARASQQEVLDALGALFAALIVGGYDALTLAPGADRNPGDLPIAECKTLPGLKSLSDETLSAFLSCRLIAGAGKDRFTYQHRRIGEYLAARWLSAHANTVELRGRILGTLQHTGIVPANLRGLWAWLAEDPSLSRQIIEADPLAIIDYGNADTLESGTARALLAAIGRAEDENQPLDGRQYRAAALVQPELAADVDRILYASGKTRFWTQSILLRQMRSPDVISRHYDALRNAMLDECRPYAIRDAAADALADHGSIEDWPALIRQFTKSDRRDSVRLALTIMTNPNVGVVLDDAEFAEAVFDYAGLTPRIPGRREIGTISLYYTAKPQAICDDRLDGILDALSDCASQYLTRDRSLDTWEIEHLFFELLQRRLRIENVDADRLWTWLHMSTYWQHTATRDKRSWLADWLTTHTEARRQIQSRALDQYAARPNSIRWHLCGTIPGLRPTTEDITHLLDQLPQADARWSELIWLAPTGECGAAARKSAERHAQKEEDFRLLRSHANPPTTHDPEHEKWKKNYERDRRDQRKRTREHYFTNRQQMRAGNWEFLIGPAQVYMGRTHDIERDTAPETRIGLWIGDDLQADAMAGFEAFLTANPPNPPTAREIAESFSDGQILNIPLILSAALAEKLRMGISLTDVPTERLQAALLAERIAFLDDRHHEALRNGIELELDRRDARNETTCIFIEPQLRKQSTHIFCLHDALESSTGPALASQWLRNFPQISTEPEEELIDSLMRDGWKHRKVLVEIATQRREAQLNERRRRNWLAVELILGNIHPERLASIAGGDRSFLWVLRDRMSKRRRSTSAIETPPHFLAAIVKTFAPLWPCTHHPSGVTTGDTNGWDATEFLANCLDSLATDPSEQAATALSSLSGIGHGYEWKVSRSSVEQRRLRANAEWRPRKAAELANLLNDGAPIDHADLQWILLNELNIVQAKIRSSSEDVWRFFYADSDILRPHHEDECSNALVTLLKQTDRPLSFRREEHLGENREGDIWCTSQNLAVAIECKRHWHRDLWTAFDWQLDKQQAVDWRARGYGIYIVYWFGERNHSLTGPPQGSKIGRPKSPIQLEEALTFHIRASKLPHIAVKVIDVSRPN